MGSPGSSYLPVHISALKEYPHVISNKCSFLHPTLLSKDKFEYISCLKINNSEQNEIKAIGAECRMLRNLGVLPLEESIH